MRATPIHGITPLERDLFFAVMNDNQEALMPLYLMRRTCNIVRELDFVQVLYWLHKSKLTGNNFVGWFKQKEGAVNALAHARKRILKDLEARQIYARKPI